ncbi:hypothetical protein RMCBS344292_18455 [Rhizopus microsporus]|nr:hypothetical protein RMCBS344292_18455 [Rhizopus microsporus]
MGAASSKNLLLRKERRQKIDRNEKKSSSFSKKLFRRATRSTVVVASTDETNRLSDSADRSDCYAQSKSTSSGHRYRYLNGRRHHDDEEVNYVLPNDDDEIDRNHQQHWVLRHIFQCNFHAPVHKQLENGIQVLDSGCGPATWTLEMGDAYPNSKFIGIDVSALFPENIKPPNVEFITGNIAKNIPFDDNTFDYIHQRLVILGLTEKDWQNNLKELYRILKPGGYLELAEPVMDMTDTGPLTKEYEAALHSALLYRNMCPNIGEQLHDRLISTGFENVTMLNRQIPINHGGKAGELWWQDFKYVSLALRPIVAKINSDFEDPGKFETHLENCGIECRNYKTNSFPHL